MSARTAQSRLGWRAWGSHFLLISLTIFCLLPLILLFMNSVKTDHEIKTIPFGLPATPQWRNFVEAWQIAQFTLAFRNSLLISGSTIFIVCFLGGMAAYALSRYTMRGANVLLTYYLLALTVPALLYIIPLFVIWRRLHLTDNIVGIIIIYCAIYLPFSVFLLRSYFLGLPHELEDAARVDGCGEFAVFRHIIVPLSWPAVATVALMVGIWSWNEFLFAITFLHKPEASTVAVRYTAFTGQYVTNYAYIAAAGVTMILPAILLFLALQRRFIQGMVAGGLKM